MRRCILFIRNISLMPTNLRTVSLPDEIQKPGTLRTLPLGLSKEDIKTSLTSLEQVLVDSYMLYSMYKKHHWQLLGPNFYSLHLLFDKHAGEQLELIDTLAERMQLLGGLAIAMPGDVAARTKIESPPAGAESWQAMITRLMDAHEKVLIATRDGIEKTGKGDDEGTNDLLVSQVLRTNELQLWFVSSHLGGKEN